MGPAEMDAVIRGSLRLEPATAIGEVIAEVQLLDCAMEGAAAVVVASTTLRLDGDRFRDRSIPFTLTARVRADAAYALAAELRLGGGADLRRGDLRTTRRYVWRADQADPVVLQLHAIS